MMGMGAVLLLVLLPACAPGPAERERARLRADVDSIAAWFLRLDPTPGMSIAVVRGGDTLVMKGYGMARLEAGTPVTSGTVFAIGSITKSFTAAAVMRLVEEGRLRLDATVGELLPEYRGPGRTATVHHLLNHTSGIPTYPRSMVGPRDPAEAERTPAEMLALFSGQPPDFAPGADFRYSNSAYYLLGLIVERVSGQPYGAYVERALVRPAGLRRTGLCSAISADSVRAKGYDGFIGRVRDAPRENPGDHGAAGSMCSTSRDLVRWMHALREGVAVSPASYERMTVDAAVPAWERTRVGYGLMMGEIQGHPMIFHGGSLAGFNSVMLHFPADALTIVVLANGPMPVQNVAAEVARAVLGLERVRREY